MLHLFAEIAPMQVLWANQNAFTDLLHRFGYFIKRGRQRLDVFALERRDKCFAELLGQLLRNLLISAAAAHKSFETFRRSLLLELFEQVDQMVNTRVRLLRARFQQIKKSLVVAEDFLDRQHKRQSF